MRKSFVVVIVFLALFTLTAYLNAQTNETQDGHSVIVALDNNDCIWNYDLYTASGSLVKATGLAPEATDWSITCHGLITLPEDVDLQETQRIISSNDNPLGTCLVQPFNYVTEEWQLVLTAEEKSQIVCSGSNAPYPYPPQETPAATVTSEPYPYPPPVTATPDPCGGYPYPADDMQPPITPTSDAYPYPPPATATPDPCGQPEPTAPPPPPTATSDSYPYPYPPAPTITPTATPSPTPSPSPTPLPTTTPVVYP